MTDPSIYMKMGQMSALGTSAGANAIQSTVWKNRANRINVPLEDPQQVAFLNDLMMKRRALETGTAYAPQQQEIAGVGVNAMSRVGSYAGGDIAGTVAAMGNISRGTQGQLNKLYGNMSVEGLQMNELLMKMIQQMAQRRYALQQTEKDRLYGMSAQAEKDAKSMFYGMNAQAPGMMGMFQGAGTSSQGQDVSLNPNMFSSQMGGLGSGTESTGTVNYGR